jgi:hypothetical protein
VSLPRYWPRTCCVYCGARLHSRSDRRPRRHLLACWSHVGLLAFDPVYAATVGEDAQATKGKGSR